MSIDPELQMTQSTSTFPPLIEHPFAGPFLECTGVIIRCDAVERLVNQLVDTIGEDHPNTAIAKSWFAVLHGSEHFDERLLQILRETELVIRSEFPEAVRALALNLAAQGCHTWFLHTHERAVPMLEEAWSMMRALPLVCAADVIKVAEILADCLAHVGRIDDALIVLSEAYPSFLAALEQSEWLAGQYDQFREEFLDEHGHECSPDLWHLVDAISGPRVRTAANKRVHYPGGPVAQGEFQ